MTTAALPLLQIVIASTRPKRKGAAVATWFAGVARQHGAFEIEIVDLAAVDLPMLDEPEHPRLQHYHHDHTRRWSESVARADAYVFVMPEYNCGTPPALVNALDYVLHEWAYKPVGFVSYGGISGGLRAVQMTKQIVTTLKMVPLIEGVVFPFFARSISDVDGTFEPGQASEQASHAMLAELVRWAGALKVLR